ncbi:MAG: DUF4159 domain-containing protein [Fimbriimonas sp.]
MPIEELIARRITGIQPFNELPIDAEIWRESHGQHHQHRQIHAVSMHRPGVVYGLEVIAGKDGKKATLTVAPGVAIDPEGRTILLSEPAKFTLEEDRTTYITIAYEDNLDRRSAIKIASGEKHYRLIEGRSVVATRELPKTPYIELARVDRSGKDKPVTRAVNPLDPEEDELNLLFRPLAFPHCYADGAVGELCFLPKADPSAWKPNRGGLISLLRFANGAGFHVDYGGLYNLRAPSGRSPFLLYVSAVGEFQALTDDQVQGLKAFLEAGGTLFAEASEGSEPFAAGVKSLAEKLGGKLKNADPSGSLLSSHHIFATSPNGASDGGLMVDEAAGIILSTADYGGAWQGKFGKKAAADSRERIRQSLEFGLNVLAFANRRQRQTALEKI